jgi:hypothetical protein
MLVSLILTLVDSLRVVPKGSGLGQRERGDLSAWGTLGGAGEIPDKLSR